MSKISEMKIDVQGMRDKILDLAMRGKLVSQVENDEPASLLLEKIVQEKEQLIKEKKIKKTKPLPEITDEEKPFKIPESWEWVRLGEVVELKSGKTEKVFNSKDKKFKAAYFKISDMNSVVNRRFARTSYKNIYLKNQDDIIPVNSIIFPKRGGAIKTNKKRIVRNPSLVIDMNLMAAIPFLNSLSSWIEIYFRKLNLGKLSNGSNVPQINNKDIEPLLFPIPPLNEQKRIVAKIEELFSLLDIIEESTNNYEKLQKELKEKILTLGMQGKLVGQDENDESADKLYEKIKAEKEQLIKEKKIKKTKPLPKITDEEKPFEIPDSWEWVRLGEVANFMSGFAYKSKRYVKKSNYQVIRLGNVKNDFLKLSADPVFIDKEYAYETSKYKIPNNSILFTMTGTRRKRDYFYTVLVKNVGNLFLNQRVGCLNYIFINSFWLDKLLKTEFILDEVFKNETGSVNQGNIGSAKTMQISIPLPPLNEQKRIATKIEELFNTIDI